MLDALDVSLEGAPLLPRSARKSALPALSTVRLNCSDSDDRSQVCSPVREDCEPRKYFNARVTNPRAGSVIVMMHPTQDGTDALLPYCKAHWDELAAGSQPASCDGSFDTLGPHLPEGIHLPPFSACDSPFSPSEYRRDVVLGAPKRP